MKKISLVSVPFLALTFLVGCNKTVEYKIDYGDTNGLMLSPSVAKKGADYTGVFSVDTEMTSGWVLPEQLIKVTSGNKEVSDYTYTCKADFKSADFKIPAASIVGDIIVEIDLVNPDPRYVTEDEFNKAISFKGVQYAQASMTDTFTTMGIETLSQTKDFEFCPNNAHTLEKESKPVANYYEVYSTKLSNGKTYNLMRNDEKEKWGNWTPAEETLIKKLPTPEEDLGSVITDALTVAGLTYESFKFENGTYVANIEKEEMGAVAKGTFTLSFENKKLVAYSNINSSEISGQPYMSGDTKYTYTYKQDEISLPVEPPVLHTITMPAGTKITPNTFIDGETVMGTIEVTEEGKCLPEDIGAEEIGIYNRNPGFKSATLSLNQEATKKDITLDFKLDDSKTAVDKTTFDNALSFKGIEYAQLQNSVKISQGKKTTNETDNKVISPQTSHFIKETKTTGLADTYEESYFYKNDDSNYQKITRDSKNVDWEDVDWEKVSGAAPTPQTELGDAIKKELGLYNLTSIDNFEYDGKFYITTSKHPELKAEVTITLKFENGVLFNVSIESTDKTTLSDTHVYSYKNEVPEPPKYPNN